MLLQLRMLVIGLLLVAAFGCEDPPVPCEDAGVFPGWHLLKPVKLPIAAVPVSSCLTDPGLRAARPNHVQLTSDGALVTISYIDGFSTLDPASNSLWLQLTSVLPARERNMAAPSVTLLIEVDAATVPEAESELFHVDLASSGQWAARWTSEPQRLKETRGPMHSPAVRSVRLQTYDSATFDHHAIGTLELARANGRVSGTLELTLTGELTIEDSQSPVARLGAVACFDIPIAERGAMIESDVCGVNQIDLEGTLDCGIQTAVREYGGCDRRRFRVNTRVDAVTRCVRDKLASGQPFHVRVDIPLSDSTNHVLWVQGEGGVMTRYSSYLRDPAVWARRCSQPRLSEPTEGFQDDLISCDEVSGEWMICSDDHIFYP